MSNIAMDRNNSESSQQLRFSALDGIRGIAAVVIACFYHYNHYMQPTSPLAGAFSNASMSHFISNIYRFGYLGVEIFFVISGFVMYNTYYDKIRNKLITFQSYFVKRLARLLPLHYFTAIFVFLLQQKTFGEINEFFLFQNNGLYSLICNVLCIQQFTGVSLNGPSWYLSTILVCYILFWVVARYNKNFRGVVLAFVIFGFMIVVCNLSVPLLLKYDGRGYLNFFWGVFLAVIVKNAYGEKFKRWWLIFLSLLGIILWCYALEKPHLLGTVSAPYANYYLTFTFLVCTAIIFLSSFSNIFIKIMGNRVFCFLGTISYSIYLWNFPISLLLNYLNRHIGIFDFSNVTGWIICLVCHICIAVFSYYILEPIINKLFKAVTKSLFNISS